MVKKKNSLVQKTSKDILYAQTAQRQCVTMVTREMVGSVISDANSVAWLPVNMHFIIAKGIRSGQTTVNCFIFVSSSFSPFLYSELFSALHFVAQYQSLREEP